jgi:hypothetical protein
MRGSSIHAGERTVTALANLGERRRQYSIVHVLGLRMLLR